MIDFANGPLYKLKEINPNTIEKDIIPILVNGEQIIGAYKAIRDFVVFTDKRVISVNVQGISGKKKDYTSMPYSKISVFSIETASQIHTPCSNPVSEPLTRKPAAIQKTDKAQKEVFAPSVLCCCFV